LVVDTLDITAVHIMPVVAAVVVEEAHTPEASSGNTWAVDRDAGVVGDGT
jgi:hypothetical protein